MLSWTFPAVTCTPRIDPFLSAGGMGFPGKLPLLTNKPQSGLFQAGRCHGSNTAPSLSYSQLQSMTFSISRSKWSRGTKASQSVIILVLDKKL